MAKVLIEFDAAIAPALSLDSIVELSLRQSILNPRQFPTVHFIGRTFGKVVVQSEKKVDAMSAEEIAQRDDRIKVEMQTYFDGEYMDHCSAKLNLQVLYDEAFRKGRESK